MKERILRLSGAFEVTLVVLLAFGLFIPGNLVALVSPDFLAYRPRPPVTNQALIRTLVIELVIMGILIPFLKMRGWTRERLGIRPSVEDSWWGIGLLIVVYSIVITLGIVLSSAWPGVMVVISRIHLYGGSFNVFAALATSIVNPVFEELFECGYLITALKERFGITTAVNVSAGIRVTCHFYQGALGVVGIAPMGLVFGYWFARTGRLWPLLVAHALQDFIALGLNSGR